MSVPASPAGTRRATSIALIASLSVALGAIVLTSASDPAAAQSRKYKQRTGHPTYGARSRTPKATRARLVRHDRSGRKRKVRREGRLPSGPLQLIVSLRDQRVFVYRGDRVVASSRISSGRKGYATPTGIFSIIQKRKEHYSNLYNDAPMPYMQRITWSGVAFHAGAIPGYPASHGCIRLPYDFASSLFSMTRPGTRVVVSYGRLSPRYISHAALPTPTPTHDDGGFAGDEPDQGLTTAGMGAPVSVFISRKAKRVYVRQGFRPLFDYPVEIRDDGLAIGTHVITALHYAKGASALTWTAVSMGGGREVKMSRSKRSRKRGTQYVETGPQLTAKQALDRVVIPAEALTRIRDMVGPGSSITISDHGISHETGKGTDFVVLTR